MRALFKFASIFQLVLIVIPFAFAPAAFAQGSGASPIAVEGPWARATPAGARTGAVYMTLANKANASDRLTAAASDVAAEVQIHEMSVVNGIMKMRQLTDGLAIPAGGSVTLKPGSYHVMLIGLKKPLTVGETFPLTLTFQRAGNISVTVQVKAMGAMEDNKSGGMGKMEMK
ncbi:MAG TPA: copper chaperone PCu(A)C [Candidatus Sulfotelmatobacter sp.]|nr:copper chaperone PCu(A)C [Candidatus Sulfotelmatobacter sp.]